MRKVLLLAAVAFAGCGDNLQGGPRPDAEPTGPEPDAAPAPDAELCEARAFGEIGGPCDASADCGTADSTCYVGEIGAVTFAPEGYCTVDDLSIAAGTCADDGDCPSGTICVAWLDYAPYKSCLPACACADDACPDNQACFDSFNGDAGRLDRPACVPGNADAVDGDPCAGFFECDEYSTCFNDVEYPGGSCQRYGCTVGDDSTCNGGRCVVADPPAVGTTCVDPCTEDADCREAEGYVCHDDGYCRHPHVGDACTDDASCGGGLWTCRTGVTYPGGYCTQTGCPTPGSLEGCTAGAVCHDDPLSATNYCVDRCATIATQSTCRTGYVCTDTDPTGATSGGCTPL